MLFERWLYTIPLRLRSLFKRDRVETELDEELRFHVERLTEEHIARGLSREDARLSALRAMHGLEQRKEECRDARRVRVLEDAAVDVRYSLRMLRRSPTFTAVAVLTLALGIGANAAIFNLIDAALLRTLPVADPESLVLVQVANRQGRPSSSFSYPQFLYMRDHVRRLSGVFAQARVDLNLSAGTLTDAPSGELVSDNYFSVLGVTLPLGRGFRSGDQMVAVVSDRFWTTRLGGSADVLGRAMTLNGVPFTVIGVTPSRFFGIDPGRAPDVYVLLTDTDRLAHTGPRLARPNSFWLELTGRLQPGTRAEEARAELDVISQQSVSELARSTTVRPGLLKYLSTRRIVLSPGDKGSAGLRQRFGRPLLIVMLIVGLVLLIACANISGLLLARATARQREMALRQALGAGRGRLWRQVLTESLVLAIAGGLLGVLFASWSSAALIGFLGDTFVEVTPSPRVLAFTLAVSVATALLFGLVPAMGLTRPDLVPALKNDAGGRPSIRRLRLRTVLVAGQVALSLLLLIGAGLFIRTLTNFRSLDAGFEASHVLVASLNPGLSGYTPERQRVFFADLRQRLEALPDVVSVSAADQPLLGGAYIDGLVVEGSAPGAGDDSGVQVKLVDARFFETMGIGIRLGRDFADQDNRDRPKVAIVNETLARTFFEGQSPLGKHVGVGTTTADLEIVGVIADTKYRTLHDPVRSTVYLPLDQVMDSLRSGRVIHVRTSSDPANAFAAIREQVRVLDGNLPVANLSTFSDLVDRDLVQERLVATLSGFFGGLALILTAIGLYGGLAYAVQHRTHEIGIRMSLGAGRGAVIWLILRECFAIVVAGIAIGLPPTLWLSSLVRHQLYGLTPRDPTTLMIAIGLLIVVTTLAGYLPARRASRVDPMVALRCE
jgi:predicted permease